jgi:hypothetical protein
MFSTLVVPLDGSQLAERAVPYAICLAQASRARLVLMQAVQSPPSGSLESAAGEGGRLNASEVAHEYLAYMAESMSGQVDTVIWTALHCECASIRLRYRQTTETWQAAGPTSACRAVGRRPVLRALHHVDWQASDSPPVLSMTPASYLACKRR